MDYKTLRHDKALLYLDSLSKGYRKFPPSLQIGLTDYCWNECCMCGHWKKKDKRTLNFGFLLDLLNYGKGLGLETVCYSGGDPMLYRHINELMSWHEKEDVEFGLVTSGHIPTKTDKRLLSLAKFIRISLDSIRNKTYSACRGGAIKVREIIHCIDDMNCNNVGLGITLTKFNIEEIGELCDFAIEKGIKEVRMWPVRHRPDLSIIPDNEILSTLLHYSRKLDTFGTKNNLSLTARSMRKEPISKFDFCKAALYQMFITPDMNFYPCCIMAGDTEDSPNMQPFDDSSFESVLQGAKDFSMLPFDQRPGVCSTGCTPRLSFLNECACNNWGRKEFI